MVKNLPADAEDEETRVQSLGWEDPLEEEMATHSSIFPWRIPWTEEPSGLQSRESQKSQTRLKRLSMHDYTDTWIRRWRENHRSELELAPASFKQLFSKCGPRTSISGIPGYNRSTVSQGPLHIYWFRSYGDLWESLPEILMCALFWEPQA